MKFLAEHPDKENLAYGTLLLEHLRKLFHVIHRREDYPTQVGFRNALQRIRNQFTSDVLLRSPSTREAGNLADRFLEHSENFFTFITTPGIEPTNNLAEQAIRFVAIHRRMTQGTADAPGKPGANASGRRSSPVHNKVARCLNSLPTPCERTSRANGPQPHPGHILTLPTAGARTVLTLPVSVHRSVGDWPIFRRVRLAVRTRRPPKT